MLSANCPCCKKLINANDANSAEKGSALGNFICPFCRAEIVWAKKSQLWLLPTMFMLPVFIICAVIDGNSKVDSWVEYFSIAVSVVGFFGLMASYSYEEVKRSN
ncbi:hypothetical protein ACMXYN_17445 [Neptuniibacter sp. PT8_73]|uniref:hypothetical protein n=1 Tax=Neptuniibacter sp. PT8_73 TaxID=3398206 RepID=UPI0039F5B74C